MTTTEQANSETGVAAGEGTRPAPAPIGEQAVALEVAECWHKAGRAIQEHAASLWRGVLRPELERRVAAGAGDPGPREPLDRAVLECMTMIGFSIDMMNRGIQLAGRAAGVKPALTEGE